ncbi:CPSF-A domain-containing protein [Mycena kentingensis (nom. inval.)]|nr:CPSF-A domain-containing protein [Mycena kentingensis (nom. inval.)]
MKVVSTFHASTSVVDSLRCCLTDGALEHLVVAKLDALEVYSLQPEGLSLECRWNEVWGNVRAVKAVPTRGATSRHNLLVFVDHPDPEVLLLTYNDGVLLLDKIIPLSEHNLTPPRAEFCDTLIVHPDGKLAIVHCFPGKVKCMRLEHGRYKADFDASIPEFVVFSIAFVPSTEDEEYNLAILYRDPADKKIHLIARSVDVDGQDIPFQPSPTLQPTTIANKFIPQVTELDPPPFLVPVPCPAASRELAPELEGSPETFIGGILVVGGRTVLLYELAGQQSRDKQQRKRRRLEAKKEKGGLGVRLQRVNLFRANIPDSFWVTVLVGSQCYRFMTSPRMGSYCFPWAKRPRRFPLTYLANNYLYVGSHAGNAQIVKILEIPFGPNSQTLPIPADIQTVSRDKLIPDTNTITLDLDDDDVDDDENQARDCVVETKGTYLEVVQTFNNIGPILDAKLVDTDGSGHPQIVTCSGAQNTGSLNVIRKGADYRPLGTIDAMPNVVGLFPLREMPDDQFQSHILISTIDSSSVLKITSADEFEEVDGSGFADERTFVAGNLQREVMVEARRRAGKEVAPASVEYKWTPLAVQVTQAGAFLLDFAMKAWTPVHDVKADSLGTAGMKLTVVAADMNELQLVLALSNNLVVCFELGPSNMLKETGRTKMPLPADISAISCAPWVATNKRAEKMAVAYWLENSVQLIDTSGPTYEVLCTSDPLPGVVRSLLLFNFRIDEAAGETPQQHVLAGLGNGLLAILQYDPYIKEFHKPKMVALGTLPVTLTPYDLPPSDSNPSGKRAVLATSSRAVVLSWERGRMQTSPITLKDVAATTRLHSRDYRTALAMANETTVFFGQVRDVDSMHTRTVQFGLDVPQRIVYEPELKVFGVAFLRRMPTRIGAEELPPKSLFRLVDDVAFAQISEYECREEEEITSVVGFPFRAEGLKHETACFCVGSYINKPEERIPQVGYVSVFAAHELGADPSPATLGLVRLASEKVDGCVYTVTMVQGLIAAGVNSALILFRLHYVEVGQSCQLDEVAKMNLNYFVTSISSHENRIVVGDRIASLSLVEVTDETKLVTLARDLTPLAPVCVKAVDATNVLAANDTLNLLSFAYDGGKKLERNGFYQLGDSVNNFVAGSLTALDPGSPFQPTHMFFTASGQIGIVSEILEEKLGLDLTDLYRNLVAVTENGQRHTRLRSPQALGQRRVVEQAYGFLDGDFLERLLATPEMLLAQIMKGRSEPERLKRSLDEFQQALKTLESLH